MKYTVHAIERMTSLGITEAEIEAAVNGPELRDAGNGAFNFWHQAEPGRRVRVTFDPITEYVVTVCLVGTWVEIEPSRWARRWVAR